MVQADLSMNSVNNNYSRRK